MKSRRCILPGNECPLARLLFFRLSWALFVLAVTLGIVAAAKAQNVLLPVYDASIGIKALSLCPKGREQSLWLIVNPNSGPGNKRDTGMENVISLANTRGCKVLLYIDAKAIPGDGLTPPSAREHVKTTNELMAERTAYSRFYRPPLKSDGWFVDDFAPTMKETVLCISRWLGVKMLNPGCAMAPVMGMPGAIVVISEQANAWPRALTAWEQSHKSQCAVMGLKITADSLPAFMASTRGIAFRYASPLDDDWRNGKSAYSTLTPHFRRLFE